ncbi:MAG: ABC transporter substrate-binding protein [Candidatus Tectomicrobia bacterium]|nr:ABC transporter substrate-binding protein [Candidatus Tectomicrobia bacterium]
MDTRIARCSFRLAAFVLLLCLLVLSAPLQPARAADTVKVGYIPIIYFAPMFIAIEKGYFAEQQIAPELIRFASGAKMNAPLATGEIQVSASAASAGLFNAILQGEQFRIVADSGQVRPGYGASSVIVRADLLDSGQVKTIADLKGKRVSRFAKGNIGDFYLGLTLRSAGLKLDDVTLVALEPAKIIGAMETKAIDASTIAEPLATLAEVKKVARKLVSLDKIGSGNVQIGAIIYSGKFRAERDPAQRFMNAQLKGARFFNDHGMKSDEVSSILTKHTKVPQNILKLATPFYLSPDGKPNLDSLKEFIDWAQEVGYTKSKLPIEQLVDLGFLK